MVRLTQPVIALQGGDQQADPNVMLKALQVVVKMVQIIPEGHLLDEDSLQKITNLVHYPDRRIKEEVGQLLLLISDEFDDPSTLLEVQKFNLAKI